MEFLDEIVTLQNNVQTTVSNNGAVSSKARLLKNDLSSAITNQITSTTDITPDSYDVFRARSVCLEKNISEYSQPNLKGAFYDLTIYNDGSDDYYPYAFGKTLDHNATTGFVKKTDVDKIIKAVKVNTEENLIAIPQHSSSNRKLEGVQTVNATINEGKQNFTIAFATPPAVDSEKNMFEMMEVYAMQVLREIPFINWSSDATVGNIVTYLNNYSSSAISGPTDGGVITRQTLLRGFAQDETYGPYVSQFLVHPFGWSNLPIVQKYYQEDNANSQLSMANWLNVQQGVTVESGGDVTSTLKHVYTPRMLGSIVHRDALYQFYYAAALICNSTMSTVGFDNSSINSTVWTDGDKPSVLQCLAEVTEGALRVAWHQKYGLNMKIRPEVLAQRITLAYNNAGLRSSVDKLSTIYTHAQTGQDILDLVNTQNQSNGGEDLSGNNYYLNVIYREGSPTHPSLPAGHATVAGACATVLKAMIVTHENNGSKKLWVADGRTALQPSADGDSTVSYAEADASSMTIVGEINKLASNVSLGRDFAGVHYRHDGTAGMLSGEEFAISFLQEKIKEYGAYANGMFSGFDLEKFDGTRVMITGDSVTTI